MGRPNSIKPGDRVRIEGGAGETYTVAHKQGGRGATLFYLKEHTDPTGKRGAFFRDELILVEKADTPSR